MAAPRVTEEEGHYQQTEHDSSCQSTGAHEKVEHLNIDYHIVLRTEECLNCLDRHLPEDQIGKEGQKQVFDRQERDVEPPRGGKGYFEFAASQFGQVGGEADRANPAAKAFPEQEAES